MNTIEYLQTGNNFDKFSIRKYDIGGIFNLFKQARESYNNIIKSLSHDKIINLQNELISKGYLSNIKNKNGQYKEADGIYGTKTQNAYSKYISDQNNLPKSTSIMSTKDIANFENQINKSDNENIINYYYKTSGDSTPYIVDDKLNNKLRIYQNGKLLREYNAIHGKNSTSFGNTFLKKTKNGNSTYTIQDGDNLSSIAKRNNTTVKELQSINNIKNPNLLYVGDKILIPNSRVKTEINPDEMTITYVDEKGHIKNLEGNLTTPAGIYFSTRGGNYNNAPSFYRRTKEQLEKGMTSGIPSSIHARTIREGANTNGCTGLSKEDLRDMGKLLDGYDVIPTYILPADNRNKFKLRNGKLSFVSSDLSKIPSYHKMDYTPIDKIVYSTENLDSTKKSVIREFNKGIILNKTNLQKDLGINNDTYNQLATYALGILGAETNYGDEHNVVSNFLHAVQKALFRSNSSPDYRSKYNTYGATGDNNSIGLTQIRYSQLDNSIKELFKKYNITKESLVNDPQKAAIATMIKLASEYKNQGMNFDKAIRGWNTRPGYVARVKNNSNRFNIYQKYTKGSIPYRN